MPIQSHRFRRHRLLIVLFLSSLIFCLWLGHLAWTDNQVKFGQVVTAQPADASQLVQQGIERYQAGDLRGAIAPWQTALSVYQKTNNHINAAIVLENLARVHQQLSQSQPAISYWQRAIAYYRQLGDLQQVGRLLTEQAQSYISLGQPRAAIALLCGKSNRDQACVSGSALEIAQTQKDRQTEAAALGSLGNAYRLTGEYQQAIANFEASLKIVAEIGNSTYRIATLNSLGNAYTNLAKVSYRRANSTEQRGDSVAADKLKQQALGYDAKALEHFQNSVDIARTQNDQLGEIRALLNSIEPYQRTKTSIANTAVQRALALWESMPNSREKVYAAITLAEVQTNFLDATVTASNCPKQDINVSRAEDLLKKAIKIAQYLQDDRSESFALGKLGHIYECRQSYEQALSLTQQAQWAADQDLSAKDSLYLWEWQIGRIFKVQGKNSAAIKAYERAVITLQSIRGDILTANRDLQLDFRDAIEPIYRELAALRLEQATLASVEPQNRTKELSYALNTINNLKLAELQNYFGNDCVLTVEPEKVDLSRADTAIFSSIILADRTAILVTLPNGEKKNTWINIDSKNLRQTINEFRRGLERYRDLTYDPQQAQQLYNWIIRPFAADLDQAQIKTIVFIQDGILRSIPMSALHDGRKFLVQKYAIATTPSLSLTNPQALNRQRLRALALGLTKDATVDGRKFLALTNVASEISQIEMQIPGSKQLLDDNFTRDRLQQELSETVYPIIHIATHGEFGTEPENTFLVTGNNNKLTITDLDAAIRSVSRESNSVELLTLTACQTAVGDDRAALGLAGVAIQAGVKSALASLWFVQDAPTATLVTKFYAGLNNSSLNKAEALRSAQQEIINSGGVYAHPAYWAPFILIGNWL